MSNLNDFIQNAKVPVLFTATNSPFGLKVHCFLVHKGLTFENIYMQPSAIHKQLPVGKTVPVLCVNGECRRDSTPIGIWLDELYPDRPRLLPEDPAEREKILAIDHWVAMQLTGLRFRGSRIIESGEPWSAIRRGWMLGELLNQTAPGGISKLLKFAWPLIYQRLSFLNALMKRLDVSEPIARTRTRVCEEFIAHLEGGPFLGGQSQPTLADLAAYPPLISQYLCGFPNSDFFLAYPPIAAWAKRMEDHLQGGVSIVPPRMIKRMLPQVSKSGQ